MTSFSLSHRASLSLALLALSACPVSEKVGDSPSSTAGDETTADLPGSSGSTSPDPTADPDPTTTSSTTEDTDGTTDPNAPTTMGTTGPLETSTTIAEETDAGDADTGDTDTDTGGEPSSADFMAMAACDLPEVCPEWKQPFAEGEAYNEPPARLCVWEGLAAGTPGRYRYVAEYEFGNGHNDTTVLVHVHADRKVTFVQHHDGYIEGEEFEPYESYSLAMTCTLAAPEYFEACPTLDIFDSNGCHWLASAFDDATPWFTDCVAEGPVCE